MTTILTPKHNKFHIDWLLCCAISGLLTVTLIGIVLYTQIVDVQHAIAGYAVAMDEVRLANADLKNAVFQSVDSKKLLSMARAYGLVSVARPEFLQLDPAVAAR